MSITKKRVGRRTKYVVRWIEEGRHRGRTCDTLPEARAFEAEVLLQLRRRRALGSFAPAEASAMTLAAHIENCWRQRGAEWEQSTRETWADIIDAWILPLLGPVPLRDLNRARVREFRASMVSAGVPLGGGRRRIATPNRANAVMTVLSAFCGYAVEDELIPENPCRDVHRLPHKSSKHRAHPPLVLERIRAQMSERDALVVSLMYLAGLRPEEVFALQWRHVGETTIRIEQASTRGEIKQTKTGAGASVDMVAPLRDELHARRASLRPGLDDMVIPSREGGGIITLRHWRSKLWHAARLEARVGPATPYDGRHTFGSLLIHAGHDILEVQRAMRHASARTTLEHYAHEFAEWKGREKISLEQAVTEARHRAVAELHADPEDPAAGASIIPLRPDVPAPEAVTAGDPSPAADQATAVAQKLHAATGEGDTDEDGNPVAMRDGRYWARTSDPQLVELAASDTGDNASTPERSSEAGSDPEDDPDLANSSAVELHGSCTLRGSHPTPRHPAGRCEDCGDGLHVGLEGTYCARCDVDGGVVTRAGLALRDRRVPDRRQGREAQRLNQRSVWTLSGAR